MRVSETKVCMGEKGMENGQKAGSHGEVGVEGLWKKKYEWQESRGLLEETKPEIFDIEWFSEVTCAKTLPQGL